MHGKDKSAKPRKIRHVIPAGSVILYILAMFFYFLCAVCAITPSSVGEAANLLYSLLFLFTPGTFCLVGAIRAQRRKNSMIRQYLALIGERAVISIDQLALQMGKPFAAANNDLRYIIREGFLPGAYTDFQRHILIIPRTAPAHATGAKASPAQPRPTPAAPAPKSEEVPPSAQTKQEDPSAVFSREAEKILRQIRDYNDLIPDEAISMKISKIEFLTARIFEHVEANPEKLPQIRSFMNYYLPTTLKMLRTYSQLNQQRVAGANITAAMADIEEVLDKLVLGFEKQLDRLFQDAALDIATDISVLESMMAKDGLGGASPFGQ